MVIKTIQQPVKIIYLNLTDNLNRQTVRYRQSALQKWQVFELLHDKNLLISAPLADINQTPKLYGFALKILNTK